MASSNAPAPGSIYDAMFGLEAPTIAQYGQSYAAAQAGLGELPASLGLQSAELAQSTALQQQQIGNQLAGNQISAGGAAAQFGVTTAQNQLAGVANTEQLANTQANLGFEQALLGSQEKVAGGIEGLAQQQFATQQGQLNYQLPLALQAQRGQAAAAGSTNTVGNRNALGTIQEQYGVNTSTLSNQAQQSALNYQGQQAAFTEQGQQYGLQGTEAQQQAANTAQGLALTQQGQAAAEGTTQALAANTAAGLGISKEQLAQQLTSGLTQIGITGQQTQDQLLGQAATAQAGQAQGLGAVFSNVGAITGLGPQAFTQSLPNLYSAGAGANAGVNLPASYGVNQPVAGSPAIGSAAAGATPLSGSGVGG